MSGLHGVSVVIRSLNESKYIESCLSAIISQEINMPLEIIVVDSGSTDGTLEIAKSFGCNILEINKCDFSFGWALNVGVAQAKYPIVVSISAHCVPIGNNWLTFLIEPLLLGDAEMVFGSHLAGSESRTSEKNYFKTKFSIGHGVCRKPIMNNGNSAFLRELWLRRPFDNQLPAQEDMEFCKWHGSNSGARLYFKKDASVIHYHNDRNWNLYRRLYREYAVEFYIGEHSLSSLFVFMAQMPVMVLKDFILARKAGVLFKAFKGVIAFRAIQLRAYLDAATSYKQFIKKDARIEHWRV